VAKADEEATFAVNMKDGTSGPAESAAKALESLQRRMDADTKALGAMQKAMRNLQQGSVVNVDQFRKLKEQIDLKKQSVAQAQSAFLSLGGTFGKVRSQAKGAGGGFGELGKVAEGVGGPLGSMVGRLGAMKGLLAGGAVALGIVAIAAAVVALTAAAIAGTAALLHYGIAQANARRAEGLRLESLTKMRNWSGVAAGSAAGMQSAIDKVSSSTALGRDKIEAYAAQLYKANLRGDNLTQALEATAIKASVLGDEAAKGFMGWAAGAAFAGQSVKRLADDVRARFGGIAAKQMLDLDVQAAKLKESFAALWSGLKIEGLLKAVSMVTGIFSQSTQSGQALKALTSTIFQPMIRAVEYVAPLVKRFFQGVIVGALLIGIALLTARKWFRKTFGDSEVLKGLDLTTFALKAGVAAVSFLVAGFVTLAAVAALAFAPLISLGVGIYAWVKIGRKAWAAFKAIEWGELGTSIVNGIVGGLKSGAKWVIDAIKGLGTSALSAFKRTLGIASPSKVFASLGAEIPAGIETGVETGTPAARAAVAGIVDPPRIPAAAVVDAPRETGGAAGGASSLTLNIGGITINGAVETASEIAADIERELGKVLEHVAIQIGALAPRSA
jgi:hypothetical protein